MVPTRSPAALSTILELVVIGSRTHEAVRKLMNSSVSAAPLPHWKPGKLGLVAIRTRRAFTLVTLALFPFLCVAKSSGIVYKSSIYVISSVSVS
jgi:hypothetical protein